MAPKRGDRAFKTDSTEAGTYSAAKEKRRKGSPELTRPMTMKRLQFLLHPSRKPVAAKKTRKEDSRDQHPHVGSEDGSDDRGEISHEHEGGSPDGGEGEEEQGLK